MGLTPLALAPADCRGFAAEVQQEEIQRCAEQTPRGICGMMLGWVIWYSVVM